MKQSGKFYKIIILLAILHWPLGLRDVDQLGPRRISLRSRDHDLCNNIFTRRNSTLGHSRAGASGPQSPNETGSICSRYTREFALRSGTW
ncbi:hypothetical protein F5Y08DRAFT_5627 [Xylaria arbuscula]|nr:hypothetical protein F5Y08DRAFT_5627 [Xylaria arbuscula]